MRILLVFTLLASAIQLCNSVQWPNFYGGSISYIIEHQSSGKYLAHVQVLSAWALGEGPCGAQCTQADAGRLTKPTREHILSTNPQYFGNFSIDYDDNQLYQTVVQQIDDTILRANQEVVISVNEQENWEQELLKFSFPLDYNATTIDIDYDGQHYRPLTALGTPFWHMQARLNTDWSQLKPFTLFHSPQTLTRPLYRVALNATTQIRIPLVDVDGEIMECYLAKFIEGGDLSQIYTPGVSVQSKEIGKCVLSIDTSQPGFHDDYWFGVPLMVRSYNDTSYSMPTATIPLQIVVQVFDHLVTTWFVAPTPEGNHESVVYTGANWRQRIYMQSPQNTTVNNIRIRVREDELVTATLIYDDANRPSVQYVDIMWSPNKKDFGPHIVCVTAVDNNGVDSAEERCFIVHVVDTTFNYTHTSTKNSFTFLDLPSPDKPLTCQANFTCVLPVYGMSPKPIVSIDPEVSTVDHVDTGSVSETLHFGLLTYKTDMTFSHSQNGNHSVCFKATDTQGSTSDTVCVPVTITIPDPCLSSPCHSGDCISDGEGKFHCDCFPGSEGRLCDQETDLCNPNPCFTGRCFNLHTRFLCYCKDTGYEGHFCERNIDDCKVDSCNGRGLCVDDLKGVNCSCFDRYSGPDCSIDLCAAEDPARMTCPDAGCSPDSCNGHGVCEAGPVCTCSLGYTGTHCETPIGDISADMSSVRFVPPTPNNGSQFTCYSQNGTVNGCNIDVFIATATGALPNIKYQSDQGRLVHISTPKDTSKIAGINHLYTSTVTVQGNGTAARPDLYICLTATESGESDSVCIDVRMEEGSQQMFQIGNKNANTFIDPTPQNSSKIECIVNKHCHLLLFTSNTAPCKDVYSYDADVYVMPAYNDGTSSCVTEIQFHYTAVQTDNVCFYSDPNEAAICYDIEAHDAAQDACSSSPCFNTGTCVPVGATDYKCICPEYFTGQHCDIETDACTSSPCVHGTCFGNKAMYVCMCDTGYTGKNCQNNVNDCDAHSCENGATCLDGINQYACLCVPGYTGKMCQTDIDECLSSPCMNGANCTEDAVNSFLCTCLHGFTGPLCDTVIDYCESAPCLNGASCNSTLGNYTCQCTSGFEGDNCEVDIDECLSNPCEHGSTCIDRVDGFWCHCQHGTGGDRCEQVLNPCYNDPCGPGTCFSHGHHFICQCPLGFSGKNCEIEINACDSSPCQNGGICEKKLTSYTCQCPMGFTGSDCSEAGVKCFSCENLSNLTECKTIKTCSSGQTCYVGNKTVNGNVLYSSGCLDSSACTSSSDQCVACCSGNFCNDRGCGAAGIAPRNMRGPICLDCDDHTDNLSHCDRITVCGVDEVCAIYGSQYTNYYGKCYSKNYPCDLGANTAFCESCCPSDFCNSNCTATSSAGSDPNLVG